jgi:hypothetical protein
MNTPILSQDCYFEPYFTYEGRAGPKRGSKGKIILSPLLLPNLPVSRVISQEPHLVNWDGIQLHKPFVLRKVLVDKQGLLGFPGWRDIQAAICQHNPGHFR